MTNATEVTKRKLFMYVAHCKAAMREQHIPNASFPVMEESLEAHLEALRQEIEGLYGDVRSAEAAHDALVVKYEALGQTADERFRDLQLAEEANTKLQEIIRISGDELRHAQMLSRSYARQLVGTEESSPVMTILGALVDAQRIMTDYLVPDGVRARDTVKALLPVLDNQTLVLAMRELEQPWGKISMRGSVCDKCAGGDAFSKSKTCCGALAQ